MKIVEPNVSLLDMAYGPVGVMRHIERCGRVCYKSEDKITPTSHEGFIQRVMVRQHEAVLEHGSVIIRFSEHDSWLTDLVRCAERTETTLFIKVTQGTSGRVASGNIRAWRDVLRLCSAVGCVIPTDVKYILQQYGVLFDDLLEYVSDYGTGTAVELRPSDLKDTHEIMAHVRKTLWFTCDRGVSHELVRHRPASFAQESTRYCNYSKGAFGGEICVVKPLFYEVGTFPYLVWETACRAAEMAYFDLLKSGTPEQARTVLPNSLKTEIVMTATMGEWMHFINLRSRGTTGKPHPQMVEVATRAEKLLLESVPGMEGWL